MRNIFVIIVACFIVFGCSSDLSYQEQIKTYNNLVSQSDSLFKIGDYDKAIITSSEAIKITDTLAIALFKRGKANFTLQRFDSAVDDFSDVIKIEGDKSKAYRGRAFSNYFNSEKNNFFDDINTYLDTYRNDKNAYLFRGEYFVEEKEFDLAINDYSSCIKLDSKNPLYYLKRGNAYSALEKSELSIADYEKYTLLNPKKNNNEIFYKRGILNMSIKHFVKAIIDFSLINTDYSNISGVYKLKAMCYTEIKNPQNAILFYSKYLQKYANDYDVLNHRGNVYIAAGDKSKANLDFVKSANLKWEIKGFLHKYGWLIGFVVLYFIVLLLMKASCDKIYDGRKITTGYWYYFLAGILGGHYIYVDNYLRYTLHTLLFGLFIYINSFNIISYYGHIDLLWLGIQSSDLSMYLLYSILGLFALDFITLPYQVFSKNYNFRKLINNNVPRTQGTEIHKIEMEFLKEHVQFKSINS